MPATTPKGWPYVLPADNIADYPITSQALATKADAGQTACTLYATVLTNMLTSVNTVLALGGVLTDPDGLAGTNRITIKAAGVYVFSAGVVFGANATGVRGILARFNGGSVYPVRSSFFPVAAGAFYVTAVGAPRPFGVGDYVELLAVQTSGVTLACSPGQDETWLSCQRVA